MRRTVIIRFDDKDGQRVPQESCAREWELVRTYIQNEGGPQAVTLAMNMARLWAEIVSPDGEESRCKGVLGTWQVWDIPIAHFADEMSRARLIRRAATVLEESSVAGTRALVSVNPEVTAKWKPFLEAIGGFPAPRWSIPVSLGG